MSDCFHKCQHLSASVAYLRASTRDIDLSVGTCHALCAASIRDAENIVITEERACLVKTHAHDWRRSLSNGMPLCSKSLRLSDREKGSSTIIVGQCSSGHGPFSMTQWSLRRRDAFHQILTEASFLIIKFLSLASAISNWTSIFVHSSWYLRSLQVQYWPTEIFTSCCRRRIDLFANGPLETGNTHSLHREQCEGMTISEKFSGWRECPADNDKLLDEFLTSRAQIIVVYQRPLWRQRSLISAYPSIKLVTVWLS